jgi:hypothetical protein
MMLVMREAKTGWTMIIALGVISVAAVALPSLASSSEGGMEAEAVALIRQLRAREAAYHEQYGLYLPTAASETDTFPAHPAPGGQDIDALPASWQALGVKTGRHTLQCTYAVIAGTAHEPAGALATEWFGWVAPADDWYYILVRCDFDGDPNTDSFYFTTSTSAELVNLNPRS